MPAANELSGRKSIAWWHCGAANPPYGRELAIHPASNGPSKKVELISAGPNCQRVVIER